MPKAVFRVDAGRGIGSGHLMRCLALAGQWREGGGEACFVMRARAGDDHDTVSARGFSSRFLSPSSADGDWTADAVETAPLASGADWLVVDHYQLDARWEARARPSGCRLLAIDDLANRPHDCDLLLDQNYYADPGRRYAGLLPAQCRTLFGPAYTLMQPEFREWRRTIDRSARPVRRMLVFFGSSDLAGDTLKAVEALRLLGAEAPPADVVVGAANPEAERIADHCTALRGAICHRQTREMARLMAEADFFFGSGGFVTFERCCLGLPGVLVAVAAGQSEPMEALAEAGLVELYRGPRTANAFAAAMLAGLGDISRLRAMSARAQSFYDGAGAERVAAILQEPATCKG